MTISISCFSVLVTGTTICGHDILEYCLNFPLSWVTKAKLDALHSGRYPSKREVGSDEDRWEEGSARSKFLCNLVLLP